MPSLRNALQRLQIAINRRLKFDIVRVTGSAHNYRSHITEIIRDYRVDTVFDVGANEGQFGSLIRNLGFRAAIHSFEPVKQPYNKLLELTANDKHWTAHNFALGSEAGKSRINVSGKTVFSSILTPSSWGSQKFPGMKSDHQEEIEIMTLDTFIKQHMKDIGERILLKMDTQGYDVKVFEGARKSLDRICCILSEVSLTPIYDGMPHYLDALAVYERHGFQVSGIFPVARNATLALVEVDCMLVRPQAF